MKNGFKILDVDTHLVDTHLKGPDYFFEKNFDAEAIRGSCRASRFLNFWFEQKGFRAAVNALGVDNIMFETDFPHPTCLYPNALDHAARTLEGLSFENKRKLLGGKRQCTRFPVWTN
jgi:hypothetical protein